MKKSLSVKVLSLAAASALAAATLCGAGMRVGASANSAPPYWSGTPSSGAIVTGGQCPVEVESERLTFDIPVTPEKFYSSKEDLASYTARVTAEYRFYNPTDMDIEMELVFPFGIRPDYLSGDWSDLDDREGYVITADGQTIESELRHTYYPYGSWAFDCNDMYLIADGYREDVFYTPDMKGRYHVCDLTFENSSQESLSDYYVEIAMSYDPVRTHIFSESGDRRIEEGNLILTVRADRSFFSLGEAPRILKTEVKRATGGWFRRYESVEGAEATVVSGRERTFAERMEEARPDGVSSVDLYNATVDCLHRFESNDGFFSTDLCCLGERELMRWYKYSLTIPAGGRLVNTVTAPLYPSIDDTGSYEYIYYLSPAHRWADFGTLEIELLTPFDVSFDGSYDGANLTFGETESGYFCEREGLPLGELTFRIAGEESSSSSFSAAAVLIAGVAVAVLLGAAVVIAGVVILIVLLVPRKKKG